MFVVSLLELLDYFDFVEDVALWLVEVIAVGEADDSEKTLGGEVDGLLLSAKSDGAYCLASEDICGVLYCVDATALEEADGEFVGESVGDVVVGKEVGDDVGVSVGDDVGGIVFLHLSLQVAGQKNRTFFPVPGCFFLHLLFGFYCKI